MFLPKIWIVCRICIKQNCGMLNLFTEYRDLPIWNILRDVGGIPVRKDDNFSDRICHVCLEKLYTAYEFRLICQRAHRQLAEAVPYGYKKWEEFPIENVHQSADMSYLHDTEESQSSVHNSHRSSTYSAESECEIETITKNQKGNNSNVKVESQVALVKPLDHQHVVVEANNEPKLAQIIQKESDSKSKSKISTKSGNINKAVAKIIVEPKKKLICCFCKKIYRNSPAYNLHLLTHTQPFKCRFCGKQFSKRFTLQNHLNSHLCTKPYECRLCIARFACATNRNKHERTVHKRESLYKMSKLKE